MDEGAASVAPVFTMKRYVYGNHPWLTKWVEDYHLSNIMKDDIAGIERFYWLMFTKASFKATKPIQELVTSYFSSYGITVTQNKQKKLVFHLDKKMVAWITLYK
jgi:hypothetical protein